MEPPPKAAIRGEQLFHEQQRLKAKNQSGVTLACPRCAKTFPIQSGEVIVDYCKQCTEQDDGSLLNNILGETIICGIAIGIFIAEIANLLM